MRSHRDRGDRCTGLILACLLLILTGCSGIQKTARETNQDGIKAQGRGRAAYLDLWTIYKSEKLRDLGGWIKERLDNALAGETVSGPKARAALATFLDRRKRLNERLAVVEAEVKLGIENFDLAKDASEDVERMLKALEQRAKAEDMFRTASKKIGKRGAALAIKAAKKSAGP